MTTSLATIPPSLRGNTTVQGLLGSLSRTRQAKNQLAKMADQAMTPATQTGSTQAGAATAALCFSFLNPERAAMAVGGLAAVAIIGGAVKESPEAVAFGNGILAPLTFMKITEFLTRQRGIQPTTQPA